MKKTFVKLKEIVIVLKGSGAWTLKSHWVHKYDWVTIPLLLEFSTVVCDKTAQL